MKFTTVLLTSLLGALAASVPLTSDPPNFYYKALTLTFYGGPASYQLTLNADGNSYNTNNALNVNLIYSPDFDVFRSCNFYTTGQKALSASQASGHELAVGPPQPVVSVSCQPTPGGNNTCLPVYASCEWCGGAYGGCQLLSCCSGYCAATKCRPTS